MLKITRSLILTLFIYTSVFSFNKLDPKDDIFNCFQTNEILNFSLFPNPAKEKVEITFNKPIATNIYIHDNLGNIVSEIATDNKTKIELVLQDFNAGIYFISVKTESKTIIKRLIKY